MIENKDGILRVTDGAEEVFNSSTDQLLHYLPPRLDGSFTRPSADWSGSGNAPAARINDFQIGTLPSVATDIIGLVRFQYSGGYTYLPSGSWFVAGGTFNLIHKKFQTLSGNWGMHPSSVAFATIYNNGTSLRFREEISLWDHYMAGPNLNLSAFTVTYRIFPAVFS